MSPGKAINQSPFRAAAGPRAAEGEARYEPKAHYGKIDQPMNQKLEPLNSNEVLWLQTQLENAIKFVERFSTPPLTLAALDRAFAAWLVSDPPPSRHQCHHELCAAFRRDAALPRLTLRPWILVNLCWIDPDPKDFRTRRPPLTRSRRLHHLSRKFCGKTVGDARNQFPRRLIAPHLSGCSRNRERIEECSA